MNSLRAAILTIGDELLAGDVIDSNKAFMARQAREIGFEVLEAWTLRDRVEEIVAALRACLSRVEVVFVSGGLGPTSDDLTTAAVAQAAQCGLKRDSEVVQFIKERFAARGRKLYETNLKQADFPEGAEVMPNARGTAPGFALRWPKEAMSALRSSAQLVDTEKQKFGNSAGNLEEKRHGVEAKAPVAAKTDATLHSGGDLAGGPGKWVFVMPGVPYEMRSMLCEVALPRCQEIFHPRLSRSVRRVYRSMGLGESEVAQRLGDSFSKAAWSRREAQSQSEAAALVCPRLHYRAHAPEVLLTLDFEGCSPGDLDPQRLEELDAYLRHLVGPSIYTIDERELVEQAAALLSEQKRILGVAESCTGGGLGELLTRKAGASAFFGGGVIVYSDRLKSKLLGVPESILAEHGAVSAPCADAMLVGLLERSACDYGVAITGIAGPGGGSEDKPQGTVFIGVASPGFRRVFRFWMRGDRLGVRRRSAQWALRCLVDAASEQVTWTGARGSLVLEQARGELAREEEGEGQG